MSSSSLLGDLIGLAIPLAILALPVYLVVAFVRLHLKRRREHREIVRAVEVEARKDEAKLEAEDATAFWLEFKDYFPFVPTPSVPEISGESIRRAIVETLRATPSLGSFDGFPAPLLPSEERRRHLYVVGKTGSGKTTYLEHLIVRDLLEGRGVAVIAPEGELFRDRLLPLLPQRREEDLLYFAPGDPECPLAFNPFALEEGDEPARAAEDLFTIFKRTLRDDLGPRMQPILQNAFAALTGRVGATFFDVRRLLLEPLFRTEVARTIEDRYVREFWRETYPRFPEGAALPILSRLDQFLRPPAVRRALTSPIPSFSLREVLRDGKVLFVDLSGLSEETRLLLGQMVLSKFQLELIRRERTKERASTFYLYTDEFQTISGESEGVWRELLSRGRKYGLALTLANQYPGQLPTTLQAEIFGNVNSLVAFALGAKDAGVVRRELLRKRVDEKKGERVEPIAAEELLELPVGVGWAKFAGGRAVRIEIPPPLRVSGRGAASRAIRASWKRYGVATPPPTEAAAPPRVEEPESFLE
ncbi:MAG TPA: type IV secretion system DNA-binding domain-containing protein [Thermoanaerobaculia bacterium]|nr:type IV secretion system DNA-binding domain-containing protein [Thermoanaerobaculia bacterium]